MWDATHAIGHGTRNENDCVPSCADGTSTPYPVTVTLTEPVDGQFTVVVEETADDRHTTETYRAPSIGTGACPTSDTTACAPSPAGGTVDPPESGSPAAGVCALATNPVSDVSVKADFVPMPRCLVIRHDQRLSVTNEAGATITVTLGTHFKATIDNGTTYAWPTPVGTYLAPGVHRLVFSAASAADIWVDAECTGPGATGCTTP